MKNEDDFPGRLPYPASCIQRRINAILNKKKKALNIKMYRNRINILTSDINVMERFTSTNQQLLFHLDKWLQEEQYKLSKEL